MHTETNDTLPLGLLGRSPAADATEYGSPTTMPGVFDTGAGISPSPTPDVTLGIRTCNHTANELKGYRGAPSDNAFSQNLLLIAIFYPRIIGTTVFRASHGSGGVLPLLKICLEEDVQTSADAQTINADPFPPLTPLILGWNLPHHLFIHTAPIGNDSNSGLSTSYPHTRPAFHVAPQ